VKWSVGGRDLTRGSVSDVMSVYCVCVSRTYKLCSDAEASLADALLRYTVDVETKVLSPLNTVVNVRRHGYCCYLSHHCNFLWSPYVTGQTICIFIVSFVLLSFFLSSPNLTGRRLDVCHTSTHGVALVRI